MSRRPPFALLAAAALAFAIPAAHAAEIAASIQYDFAQPPAGERSATIMARREAEDAWRVATRYDKLGVGL
jgi:hypothetical protein